MARTVKIIEAPRLNDLTTSAGTTDGLVSLVNDYLATLTNPIVVGWSLDVRFLNKRMDPQWTFTVITETGGAVLANPFTLNVLQATSASALQTALNTLYGTVLPTQFLSPSIVTKLDSDGQGQAKQFVAASLQNALAAAGANYVVDASASQTIGSGLIAAVQNASRYAVGAMGGVGQATEANGQITVARAGILRNLRAFPSAAIGGGATVTVRIKVNGVASALSLTFVNADGTTPKVDTDSVAVAANDLITFDVTCDNAGAPAANIQASVEFI